MKKILLLILSVSFFSIASNAQSEIIYQDSKIKVEMSKDDCNYNDNSISHTYGFIKYTNLTQNQISVVFELDLWYNGVQQINTQNDVSDPPIEKFIELGPGEVIEGSCETRESFLRVMTKHNHPKMDIKLTDIQFTINKIK